MLFIDDDEAEVGEEGGVVEEGVGADGDGAGFMIYD